MRFLNFKTHSNQNFLLVTFFVAVFAAGCATKPKKQSEIATESPLVMRAKARVFDKKAGTLQTASLDLQVQYPNHLRMDVYGPFGIPVMSLALREQKAQAVLYQEKRFLEGSINQKNMKSIMKVDFDPKLFILFAYDRAPQDKWQCEKNPDNQPLACNRSEDDLKISWFDRDGHRRTVQVENKDFQVQILFQESQTKVQLPSEVFELKAPAGYSAQQI